MDRVSLSAEKYEQLFGSPPDPEAGPDPELMAILRHVIFGEVFHIGGLDDRTRELITVVVLVTNQTLPQLRSHTAAALNVGVTPIEIREAVYQCAPFLGFPKTLNGVAVINEVFAERGITLPLADQATVTERRALRAWPRRSNTRCTATRSVTTSSALPEELRDVVPRLLTEFCFGDFYTRSGLDIARRELLVLCLLAALGGADVQLRGHAAGNLKAGNSVKRPDRRDDPLSAVHRVSTCAQRHPCHQPARARVDRCQIPSHRMMRLEGHVMAMTLPFTPMAIAASDR